ncbi:MAG TPA: hypothetical protein VGI40_22155 [Pirellulaceae bacterium]|jgi:hypothetical protein
MQVKTKARRAIERAITGGSVDAAAGVIRNVKVVGLQSRNTGRVLGLSFNEFGEAVNKPYSYDAAALRAAVPLYESARVFCNHRDFNIDGNGARVMSSQRDTGNLLGWLDNVRFVGGDGIRADLHVLTSAPFGASLMELAAKNPDAVCLSHEALFSDVQVKGGRIVLGSIDRVEAVAICADQGGTTNGLFENDAGSFVDSRTLPKATPDAGPDGYRASPGDPPKSVSDKTDMMLAVAAIFDDEHSTTASCLKALSQLVDEWERSAPAAESLARQGHHVAARFARPGSLVESFKRPPQQPAPHSKAAQEFRKPGSMVESFRKPGN